MAEASGDPRSVSLSVHIFRALLTAYPSEFRLDYGDPMAQVFRDACRRAYRAGGLLALLALWGRTTLDLCKTAIEEHARGGVQMTREKFYRLSGWAMMSGPLLFLVGWLASSRPKYNQYNAASLPVDRIANMVVTPLLVLGLVFISLGLLGMVLRYSPRTGGSAAWLGLGILGGLAGAAGVVWMAVDDNGPGWYFFFIGIFLVFFAIAFFGIGNLRRRLLPRWNGLPLLAGMWLPGYVLFMGLFQPNTGTWLDSGEAVFMLLWLFSLLMFAGLGYLLQSEPSALGAAEA